jgi:hypothetical protein
MGQFMLLTYSYTMILIFFWILFLGLSLGHRLRQVRIERQETDVISSVNKNVTIKHLLAYVHSPLDEMQTWQSKHPVEHLPGQTVLPIRYRQTLLFADDLAETHPNPVTKVC